MIGTDQNYKYHIALQPLNSPIRRVPANSIMLKWGQNLRECLYAGSLQGGAIPGAPNANDTLIEGNYREYITDSAFDADFIYKQFNVSCAMR